MNGARNDPHRTAPTGLIVSDSLATSVMRYCVHRPGRITERLSLTTENVNPSATSETRVHSKLQRTEVQTLLINQNHNYTPKMPKDCGLIAI